MFFTKYQDKHGEWRWRLQAKNNRIIADSAESYKTEQKVDQALKLIQRSAGELANALVMESNLSRKVSTSRKAAKLAVVLTSLTKVH